MTSSVSDFPVKNDGKFANNKNRNKISITYGNKIMKPNSENDLSPKKYKNRKCKVE